MNLSNSLFVLMLALPNIAYTKECTDFLLDNNPFPILEKSKKRVKNILLKFGRDQVLSWHKTNSTANAISLNRQEHINNFYEGINLRYTLGTIYDSVKVPLYNHVVILDKPTRRLRQPGTTWVVGIEELRKKRLEFIRRNYPRRSWDEGFIQKVTENIVKDVYRSQSVIVFDQHQWGRTPNVANNSRAIGSVRLIYSPYIHILIDGKEVLYPLPTKEVTFPNQLSFNSGITNIKYIPENITWNDLNEAKFELLPVEVFFNTQIKRERLSPFTFEIKIEEKKYKASLSYITEVSSFAIEKDLSDDERNMVLAELLYGLNKLMISDPFFWGYENGFNENGYYNTPQSQLFYRPDVPQFFAYSDRAGRLMYGRMGFHSNNTNRLYDNEDWQMQESDGRFISHILKLKGGYASSILSQIFKTYEEDASVHLKYGMVYDFIIRYAQRYNINITHEELDQINSYYFNWQSDTQRSINNDEIKAKMDALDRILSTQNLFDLTNAKLFTMDDLEEGEEDTDSYEHQDDLSESIATEKQKKEIAQSYRKVALEIIDIFEKYIPEKLDYLDNLDLSFKSASDLNQMQTKMTILHNHISSLLETTDHFSTELKEEIYKEQNLVHQITEWNNILEQIILTLDFLSKEKTKTDEE